MHSLKLKPNKQSQIGNFSPLETEAESFGDHRLPKMDPRHRLLDLIEEIREKYDLRDVD